MSTPSTIGWRSTPERTLRQAGVKFTTTMELDHIEAIKQAVMAGLGVAFVSIHAIRGEVATRRPCALRLKGLRVRRHFHIIHNEPRTPTARGRAFMAWLERHRTEEGRAMGARESRRLGRGS